jgi:hypothetical protein
MTLEAFGDMWRTLERGCQWSGLVKSRCKNGDDDWVLASVTPVIGPGRMVGDLSVRAKPSREEVAHAQALYARMHDGALRLHRLHKAERSFVDEAGRSFAIVASEIRNFAQRSTASAHAASQLARTAPRLRRRRLACT